MVWAAAVMVAVGMMQVLVEEWMQCSGVTCVYRNASLWPITPGREKYGTSMSKYGTSMSIFCTAQNQILDEHDVIGPMTSPGAGLRRALQGGCASGRQRESPAAGLRVCDSPAARLGRLQGNLGRALPGASRTPASANFAFSLYIRLLAA